MKFKWIEYILIKKSGLFDAHYYLRTYPDVRRADIDPLMHYIVHGWKEGRNPSKFFDTNYYIDGNPDVQQASTNPLLHFIRFGIVEGRLQHPDISQLQEQDSRAEWEERRSRLLVQNETRYLKMAKFGQNNPAKISDYWLDKDILEIISNLAE